jgi:hypothetical protein
MTPDEFEAHVDDFCTNCDLHKSKDRRTLGDLLIAALARNDHESIRQIATALVNS